VHGRSRVRAWAVLRQGSRNPLTCLRVVPGTRVTTKGLTGYLSLREADRKVRAAGVLPVAWFLGWKWRAFGRQLREKPSPGRADCRPASYGMSASAVWCCGSGCGTTMNWRGPTGNTVATPPRVPRLEVLGSDATGFGSCCRLSGSATDEVLRKVRGWGLAGNNPICFYVVEPESEAF
jgi:hypothetical protein